MFQQNSESKHNSETSKKAINISEKKKEKSQIPRDLDSSSWSTTNWSCDTGKSLKSFKSSSQQTFPVNSKYAGHTVSVKTTRLCHFSMEVGTDNT